MSAAATPNAAALPTGTPVSLLPSITAGRRSPSAAGGAVPVACSLHKQRWGSSEHAPRSRQAMFHPGAAETNGLQPTIVVFARSHCFSRGSNHGRAYDHTPRTASLALSLQPDCGSNTVCRAHMQTITVTMWLTSAASAIYQPQWGL